MHYGCMNGVILMWGNLPRCVRLSSGGQWRCYPPPKGIRLRRLARHRRGSNISVQKREAGRMTMPGKERKPAHWGRGPGIMVTSKPARPVTSTDRAIAEAMSSPGAGCIDERPGKRIAWRADRLLDQHAAPVSQARGACLSVPPGPWARYSPRVFPGRRCSDC